MNVEMAKKLREPFDPKHIGQLPKPTKKDNPKGNCNICGGHHGLPAVHLDYVGHGAVTDRLLQADPSWTYEFLARNDDGSPVIVTTGFSDPYAQVGLWINLLVGDTATPGFGEGKNIKEAISDAIRNAAMRRGVALDLWSKQDLGGTEGAASKPAAPPRSGGGKKEAAGTSPAPPAASNPQPDPVIAGLHKRILELAAEYGANKVTVQKSINDNQSTRPTQAHIEWCGRQIKTLEANIAAKKSENEKETGSKFVPPPLKEDRAA